MAIASNNKRSAMRLFSGKTDILSHRVRIVLAEKGVDPCAVYVSPEEKNEDLAALNPYGTVPTLHDRDLVLYDANIITEYLDERFPHPPLMPVLPITRAKVRLFIYGIDRDWIPLIQKIETGKAAEAEAARKELRGYLIELAYVIGHKTKNDNNSELFSPNEFNLVHCALAPILWRLPVWGITLPADAKPLMKFADQLFNRNSFHVSKTVHEEELQKMTSPA